MKYTKDQFKVMSESEYYKIRDGAALKLAKKLDKLINSLIKANPELADTLNELRSSQYLSENDVENQILKRE